MSAWGFVLIFAIVAFVIMNAVEAWAHRRDKHPSIEKPPVKRDQEWTPPSNDKAWQDYVDGLDEDNRQ